MRHTQSISQTSTSTSTTSSNTDTCHLSNKRKLSKDTNFKDTNSPKDTTDNIATSNNNRKRKSNTISTSTNDIIIIGIDAGTSTTCVYMCTPDGDDGKFLEVVSCGYVMFSIMLKIILTPNFFFILTIHMYIYMYW